MRVGLAAYPAGVEIAITDSGDGIEADDLERVFDRFYRGSKAGKSDEHVGLGLAIVKRILDLHDCDIKVSSNKGAGTTFSFRLPAA